MTVEHTVTEHHSLKLGSADPFGFTFETTTGKPVAAKIDEVDFIVHPGHPGRGHRGCHVRGRLLRKTGGLGRVCAKYIGIKYNADLWAQIPEDVKAAMREHGFVDTDDAE